MPLDEIDVILLTGGLGSRLRDTLPGRQKVTAEVSGRAFLERLIDQFAGAGARRIVLAAGHLSEQVAAVAERKTTPEIKVNVCVEPAPLGTAGAIAHSAAQTVSSTVLAANGDSYAHLDLGALVRFHKDRKAAMTLALIRKRDGGRYGTVETDADGRVTAFHEKQKTTGAIDINAGVYLMEREFFDRLKGSRPLSLETDVLPGQVDGDVFAQRQDAAFIDIGTPASYAAAERFFETLDTSRATKDGDNHS